MPLGLEHYLPPGLAKIRKNSEHLDCWKWCDSNSIVFQAGYKRMRERLEQIEKLATVSQ